MRAHVFGSSQVSPIANHGDIGPNDVRHFLRSESTFTLRLRKTTLDALHMKSKLTQSLLQRQYHLGRDDIDLTRRHLFSVGGISWRYLKGFLMRVHLEQCNVTILKKEILKAFHIHGAPHFYDNVFCCFLSVSRDSARRQKKSYKRENDPRL